MVPCSNEVPKSYEGPTMLNGTMIDKAIRRKKLLFYASFVTILLLTGFLVFRSVLTLPIMDWDEARHGVNAYEMIANNNYIIHTYDGEVDYWNLKPPLSMWQIVLSYFIFGFNNLGLRFFSAVYLIAITALSMLFMKKTFGFVAALSTGLFFALFGYRFMHLFTTADPDALHVFLCFLFCLFLYRSIKGDSKNLVGVGFFLSLDFLTKATHVVSIGLVLVLALLLLRKTKKFSAREILLYLGIPTVLPSLLWMAFRYSQDGLLFFVKMIEVDVLGRVSVAAESNSGGLLYYFQSTAWFIGLIESLLILALLVSFIVMIIRKKADVDKPFIVIFGLILIVPFAFYTLMTTKLPWYVYPSLIGLAMMIGYACHVLLPMLWQKKKGLIALCCILVVFTASIFLDPYISNQLAQRNEHTRSIFWEIDNNSGIKLQKAKDYYSISTDGNEILVPQSWLLEGYFLGYNHLKGNLDDFNNRKEAALLLLQYSDQQELDHLVASNQYMKLLIVYENYALFSSVLIP